MQIGADLFSRRDLGQAERQAGAVGTVRPTAWGRMVAHQIALETTVQRHALDTPTARKERMWVVMDVAAVLLAGLVLLWVVAVAGG